MITTESVRGPQHIDNTDSVFVELKANNGVSSKFSLFSLNLKSIPDKIELHGRTYERSEGNKFVEKSDEHLAATKEEILEHATPKRKRK